MAQNYTRQSSFADGDTITASLFNNEYNQLVNAFAYSSTDVSATGHRHDGSIGQGGNIAQIGDLDFNNKIVVDGTNNRWGFFVEVAGASVEQIRLQDGSIIPVTTNDIDLGSASLQFKDAYFDGTVNADSLVLSSGATVTVILDEDAMTSNSATALATQQSIKAYVDSQVTAQDLDFQGDSGGALSIDLDSETLTIAGGTGIDTAGATNTLTVSIDNTVTTLTGTQVLTNKTIDADNNTVSNLEVDNLKTGVLDTDISAVAVTHTTLPSALAVKTYVDAQVTAQDLDIFGDTGTDAIDLDSETLTFTGGTGITSVVTAGTVTHNIDSTVATLTDTQTLTNKTLTSPDINGGTIDGAIIGATTAAAGSFTTVAASGNITVGGTVDGRDVAADGTKLDGIEALADVTDTTNVTAAGALMDSELTNITAVKALNQGVATTDSPSFAGLTATTADINGGTIDGTVIGATTPAAGSFTTISASGEIAANGGIALGDNDKATFGASDDLQIYHNGSGSYIDDVGTGNLFVRADNLQLRRADGSQIYLAANTGAEVALYHAGNSKLATTSTGIDVTGDITLGDTNPTITFNDSSVTNLSHTISSASDNLRIAADVNGVDAGSRVEIFDGTTEVARFEAGAVDVTGTVTADGLTVSNAGANADIIITEGGTNTDARIRNSNGILQIGADINDEFGASEIQFSVDGKEFISLDRNGNISFYEDTGTTAKFYWDASAESLGIGTTSPADMLHLNGAANSSTGLTIGNNNSTRLRLYHNDSAGASYLTTDGMQTEQSLRVGSGSFLAFDTNGSEAMRIDSAGNVGLGVVPAAWNAYKTLQIGNGAIINYTPTHDMRMVSNAYYNSGWKYLESDGACLYLQDGDNSTHSWSVAPSGTADAALTWSEAMRIDSSGNVGIGVVPESWTYFSPIQAKRSSFAGSDGQTGVGYNWYFDGAYKYIANDYALAYQQNATSGVHSWSTAASGTADNTISWSESMRIDSSGNVGIGTSSPTDNLSVGTLGSGSNSIITIGASTTGTSSVYFGDGASAARFRGYFDYVHSSDHLAIGTAATERMRIDSSGRVGIGETNPLCLVHAKAATQAEIRAEESVSGNSIALYQQAGNSYLIAGTRTGTPTQSLLIYTGGTERARIDASGNLLVGKTTSGVNTAGGELRSHGGIVGSRDGSWAAAFNRKTSDGEIVGFYKDGTTVGSIGSIGGSAIFINSVGTGKLQANGSDRYAWDTSQFYPTDDNLRDLGFPTFRWDDVYATNGTIQTSDANEKQDIDVLSEAEQRVAVAAKGLLRKFRWKSAVAEKGDDARIHFGIIAQDLQAAFEAEGLDAGDYAMFIHSTWTDEETGEERSRMGVRYSELLAFIIAAI